MNTKTLTSAIVLLALGAALSSCTRTDAQASDSGSQPAVSEQQAAAPTAEPDAKRLVTRAVERWNYVSNADWIQAYDFFSPDHKRLEKLTVYLGGKEYHEYGEASKPAVIGIEDNMGYLEVIVDWTPHHPELRIADNLPDEPDAMKQTLTMIESWEWVEGEWYYQGAERRNEFFEAHPKLAKNN